VPDVTGRVVLPGTRICLVEDHVVLRDELVNLLVGAGADVLAAVGTVDEGHRVVTAHLPDVAVIDNHLPDGRGIDLCRRLRQAAPEVTLLLHSATLTSADEQEALEAGAAAVVAKAIRGDRLLHAIATHGPPH